MNDQTQKESQGQPAPERHVFLLPIYGARLQLIITDDIRQERNAQEHLFGPVSDGTLYNALCSRSGGHNFALFFEPCGLTHRIIAHELFHLTHRICEWVGAQFDHETFAMLNGALHQWVYSKVSARIVPDGKSWDANEDFER